LPRMASCFLGLPVSVVRGIRFYLLSAAFGIATADPLRALLLWRAAFLWRPARGIRLRHRFSCALCSGVRIFLRPPAPLSSAGRGPVLLCVRSFWKCILAAGAECPPPRIVVPCPAAGPQSPPVRLEALPTLRVVNPFLFLCPPVCLACSVRPLPRFSTQWLSGGPVSGRPERSPARPPRRRAARSSFRPVPSCSASSVSLDQRLHHLLESPRSPFSQLLLGEKQSGANSRENLVIPLRVLPCSPSLTPVGESLGPA